MVRCFWAALLPAVRGSWVCFGVLIWVGGVLMTAFGCVNLAHCVGVSWFVFFGWCGDLLVGFLG